MLRDLFYMNTLKISLIQSSLIWEDIPANRITFDKHFDSLLKGSTDLILLPETFSTGFTNSSEAFAEHMDGPTINWMQQWSKKLDAVIAGSLIVKEDGQVYNRFVFVFPSGKIEFYNKRHLFTLAKEHLHFSRGHERKIIEIKGWKVFPQVCYDLRFPVWSRNNLGFDLMLYVANWPSPRKEAWRSLLVARAIENQSYVVAVNRVGTDDNNLNYDGNSTCIDFSGKRLLEMGNQEGIQTVEIEKSSMSRFRDKLAFLEDQDKFSLDSST